MAAREAPNRNGLHRTEHGMTDREPGAQSGSAYPKPVLGRELEPKRESMVRWQTQADKWLRTT